MCVCAATALKMNMNLRELYLADNKLNGLQDSAQLGNLLKFNYNIQILDLRNNHILDSGLTSSSLCISSWSPPLEMFVLVVQPTVAHFSSLCSLDIYMLFLVSSGLAYICEGLKEQRKGLVTLVLWNNQLTHNGMGYLTAALVNIHTITSQKFP